MDAIDTSGNRSWLWSLGRNWGHWDFIDEAIDDVRAIVWLSLMPEGRRSRIVQRETDGNIHWAIERCGSADLKRFRRALVTSRTHGVERAISVVSDFLMSEREMEPTSTDEIEVLLSELKLFAASQLPARS